MTGVDKLATGKQDILEIRNENLKNVGKLTSLQMKKNRKHSLSLSIRRGHSTIFALSPGFFSTWTDYQTTVYHRDNNQLTKGNRSTVSHEILLSSYNIYKTIVVIIIAVFLFLDKRPEGHLTSKLLHSIAKRRATSNVYSYTYRVRENVEKYKNITLPRNNSDARPFVRLKTWYRLAPAYKLSGCIVEKSMCTVIQGIFCYLFDSEEFLGANRTITDMAWKNRFCLNKNEATYTVLKDRLMPYPTETIIMVRDPLQRFLSGFVDKCIHEKSKCFGCNQSVLCTIERLHAEIMGQSYKFYNVEVPRRVLYKFTYEAQHLSPQTWYCDIYDAAPTHVFLRYGEKGQDHQKMVENLLDVLADHGVEPNKLEYIKKSLTKRTTHATNNSPIRKNLTEQIMRSPKHLHLFMQIYRYDYEIYGFEPLIKLY